MTPVPARRQICCSFCGKDQSEVKAMIAGPTVFICDECVELCAHVIVEGHGAKLDPLATKTFEEFRRQYRPERASNEHSTTEGS